MAKKHTTKTQTSQATLVKDHRQCRQASKHGRMTKTLLLIFVFALSAVLCWMAVQHYYEQKRQAEQASQNQYLGVSDEEVSDQDRTNHKVDAADKPKSLSIAKAGVNNARIQEIGLMSPSADGSQQMDAPKNVHDVGWFNCQINPLANKRCQSYISPAGNNDDTAAVMDGHSCGTDGCVFDNIHNLNAGDEIMVTLGSGITLVYVVDQVETVALANLDMTRAMSAYQTGRPGLNLITCGGSWNTSDSRGVRTMDKRVIVYSTLKN